MKEKPQKSTIKSNDGDHYPKLQYEFAPKTIPRKIISSGMA
jgi:hypothetical protein